MSQLNRRNLLKAGLAIGAVATATQTAWASDKKQDNSQITAQNPIGATSRYDRQISKFLVNSCQLAVEQYLRSVEDADYDGSINALESYSTLFDGYTQIASFKATDLRLNLNLSDAEDTETHLAARNTETKDAAAKDQDKDQDTDVAISLLREVFFGYALTSSASNIIALRGTQTDGDWILNSRSRQVNFKTRQPQYGRVHSGFNLSYERVITQIRRAAQQFNPALPCYITGHSLGSAIAILSALDLTIEIPAMTNQLRVYGYAGPRVGDPAFAQFYNRAVPRTYRVVNLTDSVTVVPPPQFRNATFVHVGEEWSFLSQQGSVSANHAIETYKAAIVANVETDQARQFPVSGL